MLHDTQSAQISQKQDALPVITTMALWQLMPLVATTYELPQSH